MKTAADKQSEVKQTLRRLRDALLSADSAISDAEGQLSNLHNFNPIDLDDQPEPEPIDRIWLKLLQAAVKARETGDVSQLPTRAEAACDYPRLPSVWL